MSAPNLAPPSPDDHTEALRRFGLDGFCVLPGIVPLSLLDAALAAFTRHVMPHPGDLPRQSMRREPNRFGPAGGLVNPLMNIHREPAPSVAPFRRAVEAVVGHAAVARLLSQWFGRRCRAVQTLWLDESHNGPHQDAAYTNSVPSGLVVGLWVPMWDCRGPANNRLFVVPGSSGEVLPHDADSLRSHRYIRDVQAAIAGRFGGNVVPVDLARGDAVLFHSALIHGAVPGESGRLPRLAVHYAPEDTMYRALYLARDVAVRDYGLALSDAAA